MEPRLAPPLPLSGWRGERHPDVFEPTHAERTHRCPFCGQLPGPAATEWCPAFDEIVLAAARSLSA
jgi:hypothetical protein